MDGVASFRGAVRVFGRDEQNEGSLTFHLNEPFNSAGRYARGFGRKFQDQFSRDIRATVSEIELSSAVTCKCDGKSDSVATIKVNMDYYFEVSTSDNKIRTDGS